jgi:hypothetical protein
MTEASDVSVRWTRASFIPICGSIRKMIREYARHCGHADLLRERIDDRIGR